MANHTIDLLDCLWDAMWRYPLRQRRSLEYAIATFFWASLENTNRNQPSAHDQERYQHRFLE